MKNKRTAERFIDFARLECDELCVVSGSLIDISRAGLKGEFNAPCNVDKEKEYSVSLRLSRVSAAPLELTVLPVWAKVSEGKTSIGFSILHSRDTARLEEYVDMLRDDRTAESGGIMSSDADSLFI